ncbi:MAG TPA: ABC transporter substrate-binding protein, partial [Thermomicrobiales bacterium]|nr:ABC transporter substrate-binding protein [Thermomicrobiales bacterium]
QGDPTTLVIGLNGSPTDLDPHSQYDYRSVIPIRGPYEGLIILKDSETDQYDGVLAESWEANEDKSVWTFHLREGVTFQDGSPCDAEAVRASYERLLTMQKGAYNVVARFVPDPSHITAPDAKTVVFDLGKPQPLFESAMGATYGTQVVNVKVAKEHEEDGDFGNTWMMTFAEGTGTGPYKITDFQPGDTVTLEKYDGYWAGWEGDHFDTIIVRTVNESQTIRQLLEAGEVDITDRIALLPETVKDLESNPDLKVDRKTTTEVVYMTMTEYGPLESAEARQAMCYAFPYAEVIQGAYAGYAKQPRGAVAEATRGFDPATFQYTTDLDKAKELLATAGVAEGTSLSLMVAGSTTIAELFQANLAEIGIKLDIQQVDTNLFTGTFYGDSPVEERPAFMIWSWWPDYNDAWNHLDPQVSCDPHGSANAGMYCNERVDELLKASHDAANPEDYQTAMSEIQQILSQDDPSAIYYAEPEWTTTMRKDIQGFFLNPINLGTYNLYKLHRGTA